MLSFNFIAMWIKVGEGGERTVPSPERLGSLVVLLPTFLLKSMLFCLVLFFYFSQGLGA